MKKDKQFKTKKQQGKKYTPKAYPLTTKPAIVTKHPIIHANIPLLEDPIKKSHGCTCWIDGVSDWQPKWYWNKEIFMSFPPSAEGCAIMCPKTVGGRIMHIKVTTEDGTCYCVDVQCLGQDGTGNTVSLQQDYCMNCHRVVCKRDLEYIPKTPICWIKHC